MVAIWEVGMKFYGREKEIGELRKQRDISRKFARFTVVTGRRRIGKTQLIRQAFDDGVSPYVHLVITKKTEKVQCENHQREAERALGITIRGRCERFADLFEDLIKESVSRSFTLVLDEFQEFDQVDDSIYAEMAGIWDRYHSDSKINLVVCGSVNRLMNKIFFDDSQPLYGRNTGRLDVVAFETSVLKNILFDFSPHYSNEDLLALWAISGGVPRYVELLMESGATTRDAMIDTVFGGITSFIDEGRTILADEFGKEYGTYFTILAAIASGRTTYAQIVNEVGMEVGGYLTRLETQYGLIAKRRPLFEKTANKNCVYQINDCFFRFWFRFVFGYSDMIELKRLDDLRVIVKRDFSTFAGYALERYFHWKFAAESHYRKIAGWWDRKGENEIDIVCEDARDGRLDFYEVKTDAERLNMGALNKKVEAFFAKNPAERAKLGRILGISCKDM
jgi:hypothetical protein